MKRLLSHFQAGFLYFILSLFLFGLDRYPSSPSDTFLLGVNVET